MNDSINPITVLRRTFELYVRHASVLLPGAACVAAIVYVLSALPIRGLPLLGLAALIAYLATIAFYTGAVVRIVAAGSDGRSYRSIEQLLGDLRPAFAKLILVIGAAGVAIGCLLSIASLIFVVILLGAVLNTHAGVASVLTPTVGGSLLFVAPAVLLMVRWSVAAPVAVLERPGGLSALGRSGNLVRGNRWRVLGALALLTLVILATGGAIELAGNAAGESGDFIAKVLIASLAGPIPPLAATALYFELVQAPTVRPSSANSA